jgi:DNA-binding LytR/AlgR family response regulator
LISAAIVEDDLQIFKKFTSFLHRYENEKSVAFSIHHFPSAEEFLESPLGTYDLILMDINLGGMNGLEAAGQLRETGYDTPLIFITSLGQYAVRGYEVDALDFIVKPVSYYQLSMKLDKVRRVLARDPGIRLSITVDRSLRIISSGDLLYVETERHDLLFHTLLETCRTRGSLSLIEQKLGRANFLRINTCYLINLEYLAGLKASSVIMTNGDELQISRARKKEVQSEIVKFLGGRV